MDPYIYPGTSVLKNLRDIRDPERLSKFEMDMTTRRLSELARNPSQGKFDGRYLQAIHGYIFQDVYAWAGEFRIVNISPSGQFPFAFSDHIAQSLSKLAGELEKEQHLANLDRPKLASRAAHYMGELNAIHPFRDGNGRAQPEFIRELAGRSGYALDWSRVSREQMIEASKTSFQHGDNSGLEDLLRMALENERNKAKEWGGGGSA
jgi:cell filamentation protein